MLQLRVQVRNEQLPISALTRRPLFALRYNLPDEKVSCFHMCCLQLIWPGSSDTAEVHLG